MQGRARHRQTRGSTETCSRRSPPRPLGPQGAAPRAASRTRHLQGSGGGGRCQPPPPPLPATKVAPLWSPARPRPSCCTTSRAPTVCGGVCCVWAAGAWPRCRGSHRCRPQRVRCRRRLQAAPRLLRGGLPVWAHRSGDAALPAGVLGPGRRRGGRCCALWVPAQPVAATPAPLTSHAGPGRRRLPAPHGGKLRALAAAERLLAPAARCRGRLPVAGCRRAAGRAPLLLRRTPCCGARRHAPARLPRGCPSPQQIALFAYGFNGDNSIGASAGSRHPALPCPALPACPAMPLATLAPWPTPSAHLQPW